MTTSIFKISVSDQFKLATRPNGLRRHFVMQMLEEHDEVELISRQ